MVSQALMDSVVKCDIEPGHWTDHSAVWIELNTDQYTRGPGVWKFNNKLLLDKVTCDKVQQWIGETVLQTSNLDPCARWEQIKMEITTYCKKLTKNKAQKKCGRKHWLLKKKAELVEKITGSQGGETVMDKLKGINTELEAMAKEEAASSIFRSNCQYTRDGEKCSAYFLSLEKCRYLERNMKCVITSNGNISYDQKEIMNEQTRFYKELYTSDHTINFNLVPDESEKLLEKGDKDFCDRPFTKEEFYDAMMTLKPNKVPGLDGLTVEFYREFWKELSSHLIAMFEHSFMQGTLSESVKQGLISLLPKKKKDIRYVKNLRPLTLLNNDYKILAKALDNRLREVLPKLIGTDQTGFIKGRKICHNV